MASDRKSRRLSTLDVFFIYALPTFAVHFASWQKLSCGEIDAVYVEVRQCGCERSESFCHC